MQKDHFFCFCFWSVVHFNFRRYKSSSYMKVIKSRTRSQEQTSAEFPITTMKNFAGKYIRFHRRCSHKICVQHGVFGYGLRWWQIYVSHDLKWSRLTKYMHSQMVCLNSTQLNTEKLMQAQSTSASISETSMNGLSCGIRMSAPVSFVLSQFTRVTDGRRDRQIDGHFAHG